MTSLDNGPSVNPVTAMRERFIGDVAEHEMTVLQDDGLYRHLRFQRVGASFYWFDLVTWPGVLAISGDCGAFMFSRTRDMFEFFRPQGARGGFEDARWGINPGYWSEKLRAPAPSAVEVYSEREARARITEWAIDVAQELEDDDLEWDEPAPLGGKAAFRFWQAVQRELFDHDLHFENGARQFLEDFEHEGIRVYDAWEWSSSMREYDWQFLWCCWAIVWGISQYDVVTAKAVAHAS